MLIELAVKDLGVIAELRVGFAAGMTALTGETGAGKTMIIEALSLLLGGKADPSRVRPGADAAVVEGLFVDADDREVVLRRVVPAVGRSRGYENGELVPATRLADVGGRFVDILGQHAHQRLQSTRAQRDALDRSGRIDLTDWEQAVRQRREIEGRLEGLGGDERARHREIELLRWQLDELVRATLDDPDEDARLSDEEDVLADALGHLDAASSVDSLIGSDGAATEALVEALAAIERRGPFGEIARRLRDLLAEVADVAAEARHLAEAIDPDPERLDAVRRRRQLLVELRRKYGDSVAEVIAFRDQTAERLAELESHAERAAALEAELERIRSIEPVAAEAVAAARRNASAPLAHAIEGRLAHVAMPTARVEIVVDGPAPGDDIEFRLSANPGIEPAPIAKAASGGELSRMMLALHLELAAESPTLIFDEIDAGIGGAAATSVGRALAELATDHQVIVVTHLAQVAAYANAQLAVTKVAGELSVSTIATLDDAARVVELSRMLSGQPESETARRHAEELLSLAGADRGRS